jgi:hypothetical protein
MIGQFDGVTSPKRNLETWTYTYHMRSYITNPSHCFEIKEILRPVSKANYRGNRVIHKITLSLGLLSPHIFSFSDICKVRKFYWPCLVRQGYRVQNHYRV